MKDHDKRGAQRVIYISEVVCEGAGTRLIARTTDISASGVFIHSKLCCEAGSILKVRFSIDSTHIETSVEVCYSMPQIGMGVRFLDLKPEYLAAIERLIEIQRGQGECDEVKTHGRSIMPSGVEPVDKLLGGLDCGHLYLAHGDTSGKSLFGIEFLIEGLKRGQTGALVTSYSPEDAARRFARLGYDCLEDLSSGGLVIFKYPNDIAEQLLPLRDLAPLLEELESILDQASPERLVFDPVNKLLACEKQDAAACTTAFAVWAKSFGATVVLVAAGEPCEVIEGLMPSVKESFRFDVRESRDQAVRFIAFEKNPNIPDQAVRVDPSRGVSLLDGQPAHEPDNRKPTMALAPPTDLEASRSNVENEETVRDVQRLGHGSERRASSELVPTKLPDLTSQSPALRDRETTMATSDACVADLPVTLPLPRQDLHAGVRSMISDTSSDEPNVAVVENTSDAFFAMLDELHTFVSSLDPDLAETEKHCPSS